MKLLNRSEVSYCDTCCILTCPLGLICLYSDVGLDDVTKMAANIFCLDHCAVLGVGGQIEMGEGGKLRHRI